MGLLWQQSEPTDAEVVARSVGVPEKGVSEKGQSVDRCITPTEVRESRFVTQIEKRRSWYGSKEPVESDEWRAVFAFQYPAWT